MVGGEKKTRQHFKNGRAGPFRVCCAGLVGGSGLSYSKVTRPRIHCVHQRFLWTSKSFAGGTGDLSHLLRRGCALVVVLVQGRNDHELLGPEKKNDSNKLSVTEKHGQHCFFPRAAKRLEGRLTGYWQKGHARTDEHKTTTTISWTTAKRIGLAGNRTPDHSQSGFR